MKSSNFYVNLLDELQAGRVVIGSVQARIYPDLEMRLAAIHGRATAAFAILNLEMRRLIVKTGTSGEYYAVADRHEYDQAAYILDRSRRNLQRVAA